jgi:hypothetical protein
MEVENPHPCHSQRERRKREYKPSIKDIWWSKKKIEEKIIQ